MASKVPGHIAIILDGNRRFARKLGMMPWEGHEFGVKKMQELFKWCIELGIKELTLYTFSTENFKRSTKEKEVLFGILKREFRSMDSRHDIFKEKVRINVVGRLNLFPADIRKVMLEIMEKTEKHNKLIVNFAVAYGGRQEIVDAFRKIASLLKGGKSRIDDINEKLVASSLYLNSEPDLVIRPGGEIRISNFLLWQAAYSEWIFMKKLWPEFTKEDLINCINDFNARQRRFGS